MFRKLMLILFISSIFSCQNNKTKNEILDKETYKKVLKEIILSNVVSKQININDSLKTDLLPLIYKKYQIDSLQFKKTTEYYSNKPEILEQIYAEIEKDFKKLNDSIDKNMPKNKKIKSDSIKILKEKLNLKKIKKDA